MAADGGGEETVRTLVVFNEVGASKFNITRTYVCL